MSGAPPGGWKPAAGIVALTLLWLAATAWMRPLMLPDEGRYVGVAWEMMRSGDWLTPTLNGLPFFHKPPLFYWITAGSMKLFGLHEWAARAAPLLGALLGAIAPYLFIRRWLGERQARLTLVALLAQPLFLIGGQFANLDMLVAGCITATIVLLAHAALALEHGQPHKAVLASAYAMAAAGVLAKGLIGFVIPGGVVLVWLLWRRRWRVLAALLWWPGMVVFALLAAPWFMAMQARFPDFLNYFFVVQHFKRFAQGGFNNVQPFWFYPAVLVVFSLPWLPWLRGLFMRHAAPDGDRSAITLLLWLWVGLVVLFFSLPQSKLLGYVLPAVPPLAALMAEGFARWGEPSRRTRRLWLASVALTSFISLAVVIGLAIRKPNSLHDLATALASQRSPGQPVFMLAGYYYDVPFYARLAQPLQIVDDWQIPLAAQRDNWHKELADAGQFRRALARQVLMMPADLAGAVCDAKVSWVIGPAKASGQYAFLERAQIAYSARNTTLWRVDTGAPGINAPRCEGRPNAGSEGK